MRWAHSLLLLWGPEAQGAILCACAAGCPPLAIRARTALSSLIVFMLASVRDLLGLVGIRPYNAIWPFRSGPIAVFVSVFLIYHWSEQLVLRRRAFGVAAMLRFLPVLQGPSQLGKKKKPEPFPQ